MFTQPYHKLVCWEKADAFVLGVYRETKSFPADEKYGLTSQIRRASSSVPLNIVEGQARGTTKDYVHFLIQARASLAECGYLLELCWKLRYLATEKYTILEQMRRDASFPLQRMITALKAKH